MKAEVEQDLCISCALCVNDMPDIFSWEEDKAVANNVELKGEAANEVQELAESCPTDAILVN